MAINDTKPTLECHAEAFNVVGLPTSNLHRKASTIAATRPMRTRARDDCSKSTRR
jgi:hypothetical protein